MVDIRLYALRERCFWGRRPEGGAMEIIAWVAPPVRGKSRHRRKWWHNLRKL